MNEYKNLVEIIRILLKLIKSFNGKTYSIEILLQLESYF